MLSTIFSDSQESRAQRPLSWRHGSKLFAAHDPLRLHVVFACLLDQGVVNVPPQHHAEQLTGVVRYGQRL